MIKRLLSINLAIILLGCFLYDSSSDIVSQAEFAVSQRIYVYCECHNSWINGRVENFAIVEVRDRTSFGPVLSGAAVEVNGRKLAFDDEMQAYRGDIGAVEQWQEIPINIQTRDKRKVTGHVGVVFMVQFADPKPLATVSSSVPLPVSWKYSEGSMHTVDLEIFMDEEEPLGMEVRGNHTTIDLKKLDIKIKEGESLHLRVLPPWTSNFEFSGNLTRTSKAYFITSATLTLRLKS